MFCYKEALNALAHGPVGRLKAMIGAKEFVLDEKNSSISFKFMAGAKNKARYMKITLNSMDLYDVEFSSFRKFEKTVRGSFNNVYAEDLKSLFEKETSLYLSLR